MTADTLTPSQALAPNPTQTHSLPARVGGEEFCAMNIYRYQFVAACPANDEQIVYSLEIHSRDKVMVEHIKTACALHKRGYHEDIADDLHQCFGGLQIINANHHGVDIESRRGN